MEKRVGNIVDEYITSFKNGACEHIVGVLGETPECQEIISYIYDYDRLVLSNEDFAKRKRVKNDVPHSERCVAKRSNGEQCTRRRKDTEVFCGTHVKGTPHGSVSVHDTTETSKVEVWLHEFSGVCHYIDGSGNVYRTEDIISGRRNPRVSAHYTSDSVDGPKKLVA